MTNFKRVSIDTRLFRKMMASDEETSQSELQKINGLSNMARNGGGGGESSSSPQHDTMATKMLMGDSSDDMDDDDSSMDELLRKLKFPLAI